MILFIYIMDDTNKGYIYVRNHKSYLSYNAIKLGKATNIPERDSTYSTGEIERGWFELVIELPLDKMSLVEKLLQNYFMEYNIYFDGGTEFYDKQIINMIIPFLEKTNVLFKVLSSKEINDLIRKYRIKQLTHQINKIRITTINKIHIKITESSNINPYPYQETIINDSYNYFLKNDKGILIIPCGVGKTLISLWITQKLNSKKILIGVPNTRLLSQWSSEIKKIFDYPYTGHSIYPILIVSGNINKQHINNFIKKHNEHIIISTYASCYKLTDYIFDMKICDECHHLTKSNIYEVESEKEYIKMLFVKSTKQLSLTATIKQIEPKAKDEKVISNDNIKLFGEIIDKKSLSWAIDNNIICDYVIQTIIADENDLIDKLSMFGIIDDIDKRLFLSAYVSLKSIANKQSHHLLIYSNNMENSKKVIQYIR